MEARKKLLDYLYERDQGICSICNQPVPRNQATKDHVRPRSKGGVNDLTNYALAHGRCNNKKGNTWFDEWIVDENGYILRGFVERGN